MIHRPSRRNFIKTAAGLTAASSWGLRDTAPARAEAATGPEPGTLPQIDSALRAATRAGEIPGVVA
ncbi:MAG TPA: twin-arginine translocation signal domain-containing protein, partial [Xanthobacteraceae bacterium]|nr:twin-arginine translocation signal domain-containing protein [Xanthobacteraceae bacterium]